MIHVPFLAKNLKDAECLYQDHIPIATAREWLWLCQISNLVEVKKWFNKECYYQKKNGMLVRQMTISQPFH